MDELTLARRLALLHILMAAALGTLASFLVQRSRHDPTLAGDLEQMAVQIRRELKNAVPHGWSIEDEADAITRALDKFDKSVAEFMAQVRDANGQ